MVELVKIIVKISSWITAKPLRVQLMHQDTIEQSLVIFVDQGIDQIHAGIHDPSESENDPESESDDDDEWDSDDDDEYQDDDDLEDEE